MENFLAENLNEHRKGLLGRAVPISSMLVWTKVSALKRWKIKYVDARYHVIGLVRCVWMRPVSRNKTDTSNTVTLLGHRSFKLKLL